MSIRQKIVKKGAAAIYVVIFTAKLRAPNVVGDEPHDQL